MTQVIRVDGVDVHVDGDGPDTVVMMHGWPDTHHLWDATVAALKPDLRCVRFTWPGFDVTRPRRPMSLVQTVDFVHQVIAAVSPDRPVTLLLHDWGCVFGYEYAMAHPERVARIVGVDVGDAGTPEHLRSLDVKAQLGIVAYQLWLALAWRIGGGLGDRMTRWMARKARAPAETQRIGSAQNYPYDITWAGSHGGYRARRRFDPACPMLFVWGTRKPFFFHSPTWAEALGRRHGNRVVALRTGHWVMRDRPEEFAAALRSWLVPGG